MYGNKVKGNSKLNKLKFFRFSNKLIIKNLIEVGHHSLYAAMECKSRFRVN